MTAHCKTCQAEILWTVTEKRKAIPLDLAPTESGNLVLDELPGRGGTFARYATAADAVTDKPKYTSHFATCVDADQHRKPRARRARPGSAS